MRVFCFLIVISLYLLCGCEIASAQANSENQDADAPAPPLSQQQVTFSFSHSPEESFPVKGAVERFSRAVFAQKHGLVTIEETLPWEDKPLPNIPLATRSIGQWLTLLHRLAPSVEWTVANDTAHIVLHTSQVFPNVLDQRLKEDCSGTRTLEEWQNLVALQYPEDRFEFSDNGEDDIILDRDDTEWQTRKFSFHAKKGMLLRSYFTELARSYDSGFVLVHLEKQPPPGYWRIYPNYVNFVRVDMSKIMLSMTGNYSHF